ncbi:MAG: class I SAM-dependent methyltransferase [Thermodesulfobacteriota bacterium]|nr:class I SAM-dependent methyltransferase [Thermodesulfobacteriota bacterium]
MKKSRKIDSREVGLEIALLLGKHFFKTEHLHYGYWTSDLDIDLLNLPQAQENHSNFVISHIPSQTKTILDVGCGVGRFALKLADRGYHVDCVSPSPVFTKYAHDLLGNKSHIFECSFETLQTENLYDMILFSESFQYLKLKKVFQNALKFLNDGGYILICDFFKTDANGKSALRGGRKLTKFYDTVSQYPLKTIKDIDITPETAPNLKIVNDLLTNVGHPIWNLIIHFLNNNYPLFSKSLQWKYRKRIEKINRKYFSGERNAENFATFKSYRLLLYQKVSL